MTWREIIQALLARLDRDWTGVPPMDFVREANAAKEDAELLVDAAVAEARRQGVTWEEIGREFGVTRQGAKFRFKHVERT